MKGLSDNDYRFASISNSYLRNNNAKIEIDRTILTCQIYDKS